jgi:hypothetical protein
LKKKRNLKGRVRKNEDGTPIQGRAESLKLLPRPDAQSIRVFRSLGEGESLRLDLSPNGYKDNTPAEEPISGNHTLGRTPQKLCRRHCLKEGFNKTVRVILGRGKKKGQRKRTTPTYCLG